MSNITLAVVDHRLPLDLLSTAKLEEIEQALTEQLYDMRLERSMAHDWDADDQRLLDRHARAFGRVVMELKAREDAEYEAEAEHHAFEDGRHTLVG